MKKITNIAHPLKNRTGLSQRTRINHALAFDAAPIDGKTLADRLIIISRYSRYVNFYEVSKNEREGEFQNTSDWSSFFKESLPFQFALLSKMNIDELEKDFFLLLKELKAHPSEQSLSSLIEFMFSELLLPVHELCETVALEKNSFKDVLLGIIKSSFIDPLTTFVCLYNTSVNFLCIKKRNFSDFIKEPWQLKVDEVYAIDTCIIQVKRGKKEAFLKIGEALEGIFYKLSSGLDTIINLVPDYIQESLLPLEDALQEKHQPHLALLFTFLELFKHFQGNINELGKEHLDFFYQQVLKMSPKAAEPDKAHIIFELAKHLEAYPLKKDLLLKDGKDKNKQDIQFGLDHELVLDHAKITDLRTLSLFPHPENKNFLEGVYIAPVANSLDGKGKEFKEEQPKNWPSLGSRDSKFKPEDDTKFQEHPPARLGFVLASPVLLLQEGKRTINIVLNCDTDEDFFDKISNLYEEKKVYGIPENLISDFKVIFPADWSYLVFALSSLESLLFKKVNAQIYKKDLNAFLSISRPGSTFRLFSSTRRTAIKNLFLPEKSIFKIKKSFFRFQFSGEDAWLEPKFENTSIFLSATPGQFKFEIDIKLEKDFPAITFFNEENLEEKINLKEAHPLVKIELIENIVIVCDNPEESNKDCCLKDPKGVEPTLEISPYQLLKQLKLKGAKIYVEVCGVKNLIVQNDEGALDINGQLFPFGLRPNVPGFDPMNQAEYKEDLPVNDSLLGPSFYIGSKEIFYKKWGCVRVNMEWKEKPVSFNDHYKAYLKKVKDLDKPPDEKSLGLDEEDFKLEIDELNEGVWKSTSPKIELFSKTKEDFCNNKLICERTIYGWEVKNFSSDRFIDFELPIDMFKNSLNGFLKFTLSDQDFLHKEYPFVLGRQMLAYASLNEDKTLTDAIYLRSDKTIIQIVKDKVDEAINFEGDLNALKILLDPIPGLIEDISKLIDDNDDTILDAIELFKNLVNDIKGIMDLVPPPNPAQKFAQIVITINQFLAAFGATDVNAFFTNSKNFFEDIFDSVGKNVNDGVWDLIDDFKKKFDKFRNDLIASNLFQFFTAEALQALIPNEPWTPIIKSLYVDYTASAAKEDMELVHLYPYKNTSKYEDIEADTATLLPIFNEEGTLFIGIEKLTLGGNLSILFQLAEATADSEQDRALIEWQYLNDNNWKDLQTDFDVISDETNGLTASGIVTIAVPDDINIKDNTVMPNTHYWIKVFAANNVSAIAEIIGVHCQAAKTSARFNELHDKSRLNTALKAGSIGKLVESDFSVKKLAQTYPSFEGRLPEADGHFYTRVSEHLKHKGRSLMLTDYEKIVLEGFPEIYKVKCISHTMGLSANEYHRDLEIAPGFVIVAVIPDLTKLMSGNLQEPKVPLSLLEKIAVHIKKRTSPFARIKVMNPRFEYVDVNISVRLTREKSNGSYYQSKLEEDLRLFLAPWFLGDSEKLAFGQVILFSDLVGFVERLDYVDFIVNIELYGQCGQTGDLIKPLTARSILTGGTICVDINQEDCIEVGEVVSELTDNQIN